MRKLHHIGLTSAALLIAGLMAPAAAAPATSVTRLPAPQELVVSAHWDPANGFHKQCLYGVYGSKGQYKGYHRHLNAYDRGQPCAPYLNPGAVKLFQSPPRARVRSLRSK